MDRFDPFVKYADVYGDIINWEKDPMNKPQNQNKYFFSDGKTYYEQICKMLRLMSVFKEAFNQIYSNEDEISEAWENFVNNLSASVVEGSEPDVTLTWTDDSVNFEFTMVPGVPGEQGVGITSISFNSDYTMTITLSDGNTYTSMSLKGETGPQGPQGETGSGLQILDVYATLADLQSAHPTGQPGDAYQVGSEGSYTLYIWSSSQSAWVPAGSLGTVSPSVSNPLMDGTASAGSLNQYSRGDHVHPSDTSRASKEELDALIKTSQSLIDQSFTNRKSPAIQDGLARIDKIKGNTLVWNQIVKANEASRFMTVADGVVTLTGTPTGNFDFMENTIKQDQNHVYLFLENTIANPNNIELTIGMGSGQPWVTDFGTVGSHSRIYRSSYTTKLGFYNVANKDITGIKFTCNIFDLTAMFGAGNEPTTIEEFTSLFPLSYYSYNQDSLLSFNGTGIKTAGKNLISNYYTNTAINNSGNRYSNNSALTTNEIFVFENRTLIASGTKQGNWFIHKFKNGVYAGYSSISNSVAFTLETDITSIIVQYNSSNEGTILPVQGMVEFGSTATAYEPYTESTLSLPISTYFPTGMNSKDDIYDELNASKSTQRLVYYKITGNETFNQWVDNTSSVYSNHYGGSITIPSLADCLYGANTNGMASGGYQVRFSNQDKSIYMNIDGKISIIDDSLTSQSAWLEGIKGLELVFVLKPDKYIETPINPELDMVFNCYEDGTEQLLPVNGSVPYTSPINADMTYLSIDDAMEYIIEKLANVPENTQQILDSLEDDVSDLQTDVGNLQTDVSSLQTSVGNINTNIGQISSTVAGHTASISDMQSDITDLNTDLSDLSGTVTDHTSRIGTLESGLSATNGNVQNLETSVSDLDDTVTAQGTTVTALDSIISDISNNPVVGSLGSHELGFVAAYVSATLAANTGTKVTIPKPTIFPNNYTPLFIVGMSTGSYNVSICEIPYSFGNRDSVNCRVWNHGSEQTTQITVYILCMRQRQSQ